MPETGAPSGLPRQRRGRTPQMRGRYPDFDVLEQAAHWDEATRRVILARLEDPPPLRVFAEAEAATLRRFCDVVLAQDADPRIPVLELVDLKYHEGHRDGYRFEDLPDDPDVWRTVARALDEEARAAGARSFAAAALEACQRIVGAFADGSVGGGAWEELNVSRAWGLLTRDALAAFYSHPWAWNEIGFGGPAYPRGYARLGIGMREAWEAEEAFTVDPVHDVPARGLE